MTILRCSLDPDRLNVHGPTVFMTERNQHQVRCGTCGGVTYVDADTYAFGSGVTKVGLDGRPFRCEVCNEEYDNPWNELRRSSRL